MQKVAKAGRFRPNPDYRPGSFAPILQLVSLREQVYEYLREEMATGGIQAGSFLDLNAISTRLNISRTPLREALLQLESDGFVEVLPRRGFRLAPLTMDDIREFYEIIGALEAAALRNTGKIKKSEREQLVDMDGMRTNMDIMYKGIKDGDFETYYSANLAFHEGYLQDYPNQRLLKELRLLKQRLYDWPRRNTLIREWEERSMKEHEEFLGYLEKGKFNAAADHLENVHWSFSVQQEYINEYYRNNGDIN